MAPTDPIVIEDYDPAWPQVFETLRSRLAGVLDGVAAAIEHVGSTAVPGLAAKRIIDIDVLLSSGAELPPVIARLASIGYEHRGDLGVTGREAFRAPANDFRQHLYVCPAGSQEYRPAYRVPGLPAKPSEGCERLCDFETRTGAQVQERPRSL